MIQDIAEVDKRTKLAGLTETELCRRSGISPSTLWRWRKGKFEPKMRTVRALNDALVDAERAVTSKPRAI